MEKVWEILNYPKDELIKDVMNTLGVKKKKAIDKINNGKIVPSSTKAHFRFYVQGYKYPILTVDSEDLMNFTGGFIDKFIQDYRDIKTIHKNKYSNNKKVQMLTGISMKAIWGKPEQLQKAIYEIKNYLIEAEVDKIEGPRIADRTASNYHKILKGYDLRFGRGIQGGWGTIRLLLDSAEKIKQTEYFKIRNSLELDDWENMIKFETALCKKRPNYDPIDILNKDEHFAKLFQFNILKDVINGYDDDIAEKLVFSTAWVSKNIFKYLSKGDWLAVSTLHSLGSHYMEISDYKSTMIKPSRFWQEFNIPKNSFYRQIKRFEELSSCKLPGQPSGGFIELDPPTFLDIF